MPDATPTLDELAADGVTVWRPGSDGYDSARTLWNAMIDRRPRLVLQPHSTQQVAACVRYARASGLAVAVKGGGHSAPGYSVCGDDGVMIDLAALDGVSVDPVTKEARVQGGALLGALDRATAPHGLVVPAGAISHTGAGGLVLGGGFGHLMRRFGLSIDSMLSAEVVLADGTVVQADPENEPDLFWALRGGSGNFGIVTEFRFRCHDFGPEIFLSACVIELEHAWPALEAWRAEMADAPDELAWIAFFRGAPDLPGFEWIPERLRGRPILLMPLIWAGDPEEGRRYIGELTSRLPVVAAQVEGLVPFVEVQRQWDEVFRHGLRHYAKAGFLQELPDDALRAVVDLAAELPHPACQVEILRLGGAVARVDERETAFPHRSARWPVNIIGLWEDADEDAPGIEWVRRVYDVLEPHMSGGMYVNYFGGEETGGAAAAYGPTWHRLVTLKERYDPDNVFRFNANLRRSTVSTDASPELEGVSS